MKNNNRILKNVLSMKMSNLKTKSEESMVSSQTTFPYPITCQDIKSEGWTTTENDFQSFSVLFNLFQYSKYKCIEIDNFSLINWKRLRKIEKDSRRLKSTENVRYHFFQSFVSLFRSLSQFFSIFFSLSVVVCPLQLIQIKFYQLTQQLKRRM